MTYMETGGCVHEPRIRAFRRDGARTPPATSTNRPLLAVVWRWSFLFFSFRDFVFFKFLKKIFSNNGKKTGRYPAAPPAPPKSVSPAAKSRTFL